jgi:hypothetical protein
MSRFRPVVFSASTKHIPGGANSHLCWQRRELQCLGQYEATAARNDSEMARGESNAYLRPSTLGEDKLFFARTKNPRFAPLFSLGSGHGFRRRMRGRNRLLVRRLRAQMMAPPPAPTPQLPPGAAHVCVDAFDRIYTCP